MTVMLLLLTEDLKLQMKLLLLQDLGVRRIQMGRIFFLVRSNVPMVL